MNMLPFNIFMALLQLAVLSNADNLTSTIETTEKDMKSTTQNTLLTPVLPETEHNVNTSKTARTAILRIEPEEQETAKIVDVLMEQLVEKDKLNTNDTQETGNTTEMMEVEKTTPSATTTTPAIDLKDSDIHQNSEIEIPGKIADPAPLEQKLPDPSPTSPSREPQVRDNADRKTSLVNVIVEQTEHQQTGIIQPSSSTQPYSENGIREEAKLNIEDSKQVSPTESTTSMLEQAQTISVILSRGAEVQHKSDNGISDAHVVGTKLEKRDEQMDANDHQLMAASDSQTQEKQPTEVPVQRTNTESATVAETTQIVVEKTEKPSLLERMKHNRHRKYKSEEEEDKSEGPVPCTCGVFLSGQFKKGSKQQPKGMPVLTQETDTPFMNNAVGNRQCTNKCLELIIKHLPKSSEIICATVDRDNVFKERAYLFIKNHSDKWHGTNLSAGREFCCRDNTPYKCPVSQ